MSIAPLTPAEAGRWSGRAGLPLHADRHAEIAAVAQHIHTVVATLRELDFGDTPPASAYRTGGEKRDAAV
ncbi:hypothetical protein ACIHAA_15590 [Streptomyces sp. NPDC052040]|uniref:hypothetical protein n=1 Tax=unclassified Streptomyces TaxID=2593676 RepID=UPI0037D3A2F4